MWYKYTNGMNFHVKFEEEGMSYQALAKSKPEMWWGPFPFNSIKTLKDEYIITWYEEGYGDYVTLLVDEKNKTIYGSALIILKDKFTLLFVKQTKLSKQSITYTFLLSN